MIWKRQTSWEDMDKSRIALSVLIQHFEVHNRTEGKSPRTVGWYNEVLSMFLKWLQSEGMPTDLKSMGENEVRQFILYIQNKPGIKGPMSTYSVANRVRALKGFFSWLHLKGYTNEYLLKDIKEPKTKGQIIEPLTPEEIEDVFSAINPNTALGARNTAIVSLMLDSGLRLSEVSHLQEHDVHLEDW